MLGALVALLAATLAVVALRGRTRPGALDAAVTRAVQGQRQLAAEERDAAVRAAVEQVVVQNREVIGRERELVGQDLAHDPLRHRRQGALDDGRGRARRRSSCASWSATAS